MAYPTSLDELTDGVPSDVDAPSTAMNDATYPHDDHHRALAVAVEAVEAELGTDPSGSEATVKARIAATEAVANAAAVKASNLSDLTSAATARTNLGLGGAATLAVGTTAGTVAAGDDSRFPPSGTGYLSGNYYAPLFAGGYSTAYPSSNAVNSNNLLQFCQFRCNAAFTADRITIDIRSAGDAGSVVRVGIWRDSGFGQPGTLVLDAGTVSGTTVATQSITISQALTPGMYWLGAVWQGLSAVNPTWTALNATNQTANMENQIANPATNGWADAWAAKPVSGALASNPTVFTYAGGSAPRIWLRAA